MLYQWLRFAPLALVLAGCRGGLSTGQVGELGKGSFSYKCVANADPVCRESLAVEPYSVAAFFGLDGQLPAAVATGARFDLGYYGAVYDGLERLELTLTPATSQLVSSKGGYQAARAGAYAFLARSPSGVTADFVHVEVVDPAALELWARGQRIDGKLQLKRNESVDVGVLALGQGGTPLAGGAVWSWSLAGPQVAKIQPLANSKNGGTTADDEITLVAGSSQGTAKLGAKLGAISQTVDIEVTP